MFTEIFQVPFDFIACFVQYYFKKGNNLQLDKICCLMDDLLCCFVKVSKFLHFIIFAMVMNQICISLLNFVNL